MSNYDVFFAFASPDVLLAQSLAGVLRKRGLTVFLSNDSIQPGSGWDTDIPLAQSRSRITAVLVSRSFRGAHYQRGEVATGIQQSRDFIDHRVVPILVKEPDGSVPASPYGLAHVQALTVTRGRVGVDAAVDSIEALVRPTPSRLQRMPSQALAAILTSCPTFSVHGSEVERELSAMGLARWATQALEELEALSEEIRGPSSKLSHRVGPSMVRARRHLRIIASGVGQASTQQGARRLRDAQHGARVEMEAALRQLPDDQSP